MKPLKVTLVRANSLTVSVETFSGSMALPLLHSVIIINRHLTNLIRTFLPQAPETQTLFGGTIFTPLITACNLSCQWDYIKCPDCEGDVLSNCFYVRQNIPMSLRRCVTQASLQFDLDKTDMEQRAVTKSSSRHSVAAALCCLWTRCSSNSSRPTTQPQSTLDCKKFS